MVVWFVEYARVKGSTGKVTEMGRGSASRLTNFSPECGKYRVV